LVAEHLKLYIYPGVTRPDPEFVKKRSIKLEGIYMSKECEGAAFQKN